MKKLYNCIFHIITGCIAILIFPFFSNTILADETGFLPPTTCFTDGSSCENMLHEDTNYNSWVNTVSENVVVTFAGFGIPDEAIIDDIEIKLRIKTLPKGGWTWNLLASIDSGKSYFWPNSFCHSLPTPCHYNTRTLFNSITLPTMTWKNVYPVTGANLNSPSFRLLLAQTTGFKSTDIDALYFNVRYHLGEPSPTSSPTPTLSPTPAPTKVPLLLIPGMGGSELKITEDMQWSNSDGHGGVFTHTYQKGEKVWMNEDEALKPGSDDYFDVLRMKPDGQEDEGKLATTGNVYKEMYQSTIDFFISHGYILNKSLFIFPYDWRKNIDETSQLFDHKIEEIKQQTGSENIDIVAHSLGGLVARNYIADPDKAKKVRKLFTLGTPHLGSVQSIKTLMYGDCLTDYRLKDLPFCVGIPHEEIKDIVHNMLSGYQLLPSKAYFNFFTNEDPSHPYPLADLRDIDGNGEIGPLNYSQIKSLLTNLGYNIGLFGPSEAFHKLDGTLPETNGVEIVNIVGSGMPTLGQIIEKYSTNFFGSKIQKKDEVVINGDDTVPLLSASLIDTKTNTSLLGNAKVYYVKQGHGALIAPGSALQLVNSALEGADQLPAGVSTKPFSYTGTRVSVHSPVEIHTYDSLGNHTGPTTDGFEENIPGSVYDTLDDTKFIYLPENDIYRITLNALDKGSFDFVIRDYENSGNTVSTFYKNIPLEENAKAETLLDTSSQQLPVLSIDENGDNVTDREINPSSQTFGEQNTDYIPPRTTSILNGAKGANDWFISDVNVSLEAVDDNSGVSTSEYTVDNGQTIHTYTEPLSLTKDGIYTLKFRSTDNAGNEESPKEITVKIDKTPPEAKIRIDHDNKDIVIQGVDVNQTNVEKHGNSSYLITDIAGNKLKLDVEDTDKEKQNRLRIFSMQYNAQPKVLLKSNQLTATYQGKKRKIYVKEQRFEIKNKIKIKILYDIKKDKSTIIKKGGKQKPTKKVRSGSVKLELTTNQGKLRYHY